MIFLTRGNDYLYLIATKTYLHAQCRSFGQLSPKEFFADRWGMCDILVLMNWNGYEIEKHYCYIY